jgi:hypothetical protein
MISQSFDCGMHRLNHQPTAGQQHQGIEQSKQRIKD